MRLSRLKYGQNEIRPNVWELAFYLVIAFTLGKTKKQNKKNTKSGAHQ